MCLGVGECWESGGVVRSPGGSKCPHRFRGLEEAGSATSQGSWPPLTCILKVCSSQPGMAGISRRQPGPSSDQLGTERHPLEHGGFPGGSICNTRDAGSIPGSGRSPGGRHGNPLQYSGLEKSMDRGAWWATVWRVTESDMTEATDYACVHWNMEGPQRNLA